MICRDSSCLLKSFETFSPQVFFTALDISLLFSGIEDKTNADKFEKHRGLGRTQEQWLLIIN